MTPTPTEIRLRRCSWTNQRHGQLVALAEWSFHLYARSGFFRPGYFHLSSVGRDVAVQHRHGHDRRAAGRAGEPLARRAWRFLRSRSGRRAGRRRGRIDRRRRAAGRARARFGVISTTDPIKGRLGEPRISTTRLGRKAPPSSATANTMRQPSSATVRTWPISISRRISAGRSISATFDPATAGPLTLRMRYDDGAAVYLNGVEVVRSRLVPDAGFDSLATSLAHDDGAEFQSLRDRRQPACRRPQCAGGRNPSESSVQQRHQFRCRACIWAERMRRRAAPSGVLANDTDADGDPLTAVLVSGPQHGQSYIFRQRLVPLRKRRRIRGHGHVYLPGKRRRRRFPTSLR